MLRLMFTDAPITVIITASSHQTLASFCVCKISYHFYLLPRRDVKTNEMIHMLRYTNAQRYVYTSQEMVSCLPFLSWRLFPDSLTNLKRCRYCSLVVKSQMFTIPLISPSGAFIPGQNTVFSSGCTSSRKFSDRFM